MSAVEKINARAVEALLHDHKAVLIDVRTPGEILGGEIPESVIMPFDLVSAKRLEPIVDTNKKIVFVCHSGNRAGQAADAVSGLLPDVAVLDGGVAAWKQAGLPMTEGRDVIPIERQVQITVGSLLILTVLLTYFVSTAFLIFPGLFGAGLVYAGWSGSCGMARVLLMMPWNQHPLCTSGTCGKSAKHS